MSHHHPGGQNDGPVSKGTDSRPSEGDLYNIYNIGSEGPHRTCHWTHNEVLDREVKAISELGVMVDGAGLRAYVEQATAEAGASRASWLGWLDRLGIPPAEPGDNSAARAALRAVGLSGISLARGVLESSGHPLATALAGYRAARTCSAGAEGLLAAADGESIIRSQCDRSVTDRLQNHHFNIQGIARGLRQFVIARPGHVLLYADVVSQDYVVLAELSRDPALIEIVSAGQDIHCSVAALIHGCALDKVDSEMRQAMKPINLGVLYGQGAKSIAKELGVSIPEAQAALKRWEATFPVAAEFLREAGAKAAKGRAAESPTGARRVYPADVPAGYVRRSGRNYPIQQTAAAWFCEGLLALAEALPGVGGRVVAVIHDGYLVEIPELRASEGRRVVESSLSRSQLVSLPFRVVVSVGRNWGEAMK